MNSRALTGRLSTYVDIGQAFLLSAQADIRTFIAPEFVPGGSFRGLPAEKPFLEK